MRARAGVKLGAEDMSKKDPSVRDPATEDKAMTARARQRAIGRELRRMYDDVVHEPVPDDFIDLLRKIDETSGNKKDKLS